MPIQIVWDDAEKTVIHYLYEGQWTWNELYTVLGHARELMGTVNHPIDSIVDMSRSTYIPPGALTQLRRVYELNTTLPNSSGFTVFLKAEMFAKALIEMFERIYPQQAGNVDVTFAETLEEARTKIEHDRVKRTL